MIDVSKAKPILFSTKMVLAILDGMKMQTRRVCKALENYDFSWGLDRKPYIGDYKTFAKVAPRKWDNVTLENVWLYDLQTAVDESKTYVLKPSYQPGDILWVRETWFENEECLLYKASKYENTKEYHGRNGWVQIKWRPSIFMPRKAARIFLKVTNVKVERLQEITAEDVIREGIKYSDSGPYHWHVLDTKLNAWINFHFHDEAFKHLWDSLNAKRGYGWDTNPWVWVYEFEDISREVVVK